MHMENTTCATNAIDFFPYSENEWAAPEKLPWNKAAAS